MVYFYQMKTLKTILPVFLLFFGSYFSIAQVIDVKKQLHQAESYFAEEDFDDALPLFLKVLEQDRNNDYVRYKTGICYLLDHGPEKNKAEVYLEQALIGMDEKMLEGSYKNKKSPPIIWFYLGQAYHFNYKFDEALNAYEKFKPFINIYDTAVTTELKRRIEWTNTAKNLMAHQAPHSISNLGNVINTPYPEHSPVISTDEITLLFTARKPQNVGGKIDSEDHLPFEDIYISYYSASGWSEAMSIGSSINTERHEATIALSSDGTHLLLYKDDGNGDGNIYLSTLVGKEWSAPQKLDDNIDSPKWETSACFSPDGSMIYIASNREGGFGGRDLWTSKKLPNGHWSKCQNMGPAINTRYDEDAPALQANGKLLYFSSNGHETMGGFDVFSTEQDENGNWSAIKNVGHPVNSTDDDIFFMPTADNKHAYFSSYRHLGGFGEKDIYKITFPENEEANLTVFTGKISSIFGDIPNDVTINITDNETGELVGTYKPNPATGKYLIILQGGKNYNISYEAEGYLLHSENVNVKESSSYQKIHNEIVLSPIKVGKKIVLKNLFFNTAQSTLLNESRVELKKVYEMLNQHKGLVIQISGHTDAEGTDASNLKLSNQRAESVAKFLTDAGITVDRIKTKGYGESEPIAINFNEDGTQNKKGMTLNRRFELVILGTDGKVEDVVEEIKVDPSLKKK